MMFKFFSFILIFLFCDVCYSQVRVTVDQKSNALIVRAPKDQQIQIKKVIESLDLVGENDIVKVLPLENTSAGALVPVLTNVMRAYKPLMNVSISSNGLFDPSFNGVVMSDDRSNQLIIIADKSTINNLILVAKQLDKPMRLEDNILFKKLKNANSSDIGNIINNISKR